MAASSGLGAEAAGEAFCRVALPRPVLGTFAYRLPPGLAGEARPGVRVVVPFGRRRLVGVIDRLAGPPARPTRDVADLLDPEPIVSAPLLDLCRWIADYYAAPPGLVLRTALPPGVFHESALRVSRGPAAVPPGGLEDDERRLLARVAAASAPLRAATLTRELGLAATGPVLRRLAERGLVTVDEEPPRPPARPLTRQVVHLIHHLPTLLSREEAFGRARRQREAYEALEALGGAAPVGEIAGRLGFGRGVVRGLVERGLAEVRDETVRRDPFASGDGGEETAPRGRAEGREVPTPAQAEAIAGLREQASRPEPGAALLRGVTGSGKTLVYLELLETLIGAGRGAIVLVPEIALTPQTVRRFRARFGGTIALLHSALGDGERYDEWRALRSRKKRLAIGTRSAVFAPVADLAAIILDEEHDASYKQSDTPRYHARAVAAVRARVEGALCLLGSATPSLESWANARAGRWRLYELPERVTGHPLPRVELVDLRAEREARDADPAGGVGRGEAGNEEAGSGDAAGAEPRRGPVVLSRRLRDALASRLARGEQAILLLNRRGWSTFLQCPGCGRVWSCRRCSVSLTHHRRPARLLCHHCGFQEPVPEACDACGSAELSRTGLGTQQVEERLGEAFPAARIARMDVDTTRGRGAHHAILERVRRGEADILLGTQMIAKGLDFPGVTLVGVIHADVGLNLPDFRASERTFQLLAQVAGRAGRGGEPGEVLVQTSRPGHPALRAAVEHDYPGFAEAELADRLEPGYPPHRRLANLVLSGRDERAVAAAAIAVVEWTEELLERRGLRGVEVVGPAPCPIERLRGRWRWHFLLKADDAPALGTALRHLARAKARPAGDVRLEIDRDPEALL